MAWTVVDGPDGNPVLKCVINRYSVSQWFVLTVAGLYDSVDGGLTWSTLLAAEEGETFRDVCFSHTRGWIVVMSGGRLAVAIGGTAQTFPVLDPVVSDVVAVAADITEDRFYCYDASGRTFYTAADGGTAFSQGADLPAACVVQPRGLWRDGAIRGLLYVAGGTGGAWKSLDGFASSGAYFQIRKPGVGNCPANADFRQIGADGLLSTSESGPVDPTVIGSAPGSGKVYAFSWSLEPPTGYETFAYDDGAWTATTNTHVPIPGAPAGSAWVSHNTQWDHAGLAAALRHEFSLLGVTSDLTLTVRADNILLAVYFNETLVWSGSAEWLAEETPNLVIDIDPALAVEGENLLAFHYKNAPGGHPIGIAYALAVS
jgi:hypothetical protein